MYCINCGAELKDGVTFCTKCGAKQNYDPTETQVLQVGVGAAQGTADAWNNAPADPYAPSAATESVYVGAPPVIGQQPVQDGVYAQTTITASPEQRKKGKGKTIAAVSIIIVLLAVIGVLVYFFVLPNFLGDSEDDASSTSSSVTATTATLPNLSGMTEPEATAALKNLGFSEVSVIYAAGDKDKVIAQKPATGESAPLDTIPQITIGTGPVPTGSSSATGSTIKFTVENPRTNKEVTVDIRRTANGYIIDDIMTKAYTKSEIEALNLTDAELYLARNEIVARTGYKFKNKYNNAYFTNQCPWYNGVNSSYKLTGIPADNADVIASVEKDRGSWYLEIE